MTVVKPVPLVNAANALTVVRIVLVPVFVAFALAGGAGHTGWQLAAFAAFAVASVTDYVDGWIARTHNLVTSFGKVADPIADKALTGTALVVLSASGQVPWWVTVVILVREWGVTALRFWVIRHGVIPASRGGKVKTALQILAIGWYLLPLPHVLAQVAPWLMAAAVIVTVVTGADYVVRAFRVRRAAADRSFPSGGTADAALPKTPAPGSPGLQTPGRGELEALGPPATVISPAPAVAPPADEPVA